MTLAEIITADASDVFLDTDEFAESVVFYPGGESINSSTITAVVVWDDLEGTREAHGDGVVLEKDSGTAVRQSVKLEISVSVDADDTRRPADLFKLADGTVVALKRILGKDGGMQTLLCTRRSDVTIRRPVRSG